MSNGVIYLLTGLSHAVRLVVSVWSLRKRYDGPVTIFFTSDQTRDVAERCANTSLLNVDIRHVTPVEAPRNVAFITKIRALECSPYEHTAYLDADTLVVGCIEELLLPRGDCEVTATHFADWTTTRSIMQGRIKRWRGLQQTLVREDWIDRMVRTALRKRPAINGGVLAVRRASPILKAWMTLSLAGCKTFICDEIALQLLLTEFAHHLLDCRYNCSPVYAAETTDVRVWHFHGNKHVRDGVGGRAWLATFRECMRDDVAGLDEWIPADRRLMEYLARDESAHADSHSLPAQMD